MNNIQGGRWDQLLRKLFPVKEKSIAPAIAPEIVPMVVVQKFEPEMYAIKNEFLAIAGQHRAATAANHTFFSLEMPSLSDVLVEVTSIHVYRLNGPGGSIQLRWLPTSSGGSAFGSGYRDSRRSQVISVAQTIPTVFSGAEPTIIGSRIGEYGLGLDEKHVIDQPFVLGPGAKLSVWSVQQNSDLGVTFHWREREAERTELTQFGGS